MQSRTYQKIKNQIQSATSQQEVQKMLDLAEKRGANYVQIRDLKALVPEFVSVIYSNRNFVLKFS